MFSYLKGKLTEKTPMRIVLDCSGIGYEIRIPLSTFEKLGDQDEEAKLFVHLSLSDDDMKLYGFHSFEEKELFLLLISIAGIGPKIALSILSAMTVRNFAKFIRTENDNALTIVPGLGKKTAQRLILELKDKLSSISLLSLPDEPAEGRDKLLAEAESALVTLGYNASDISIAIEDLYKEEAEITSSEQLIKKTIQYLYKNRYTRKKKK